MTTEKVQIGRVAHFITGNICVSFVTIAAIFQNFFWAGKKPDTAQKMKFSIKDFFIFCAVVTLRTPEKPKSTKVKNTKKISSILKNYAEMN